MSWQVKVTEQNVDEMANVAEAMRSHLGDLLRQIQRYPLEVHFAGYTILFDRQEDVRRFIDWLDKEVARVRPAA